jgi:hypothetical protein
LTSPYFRIKHVEVSGPSHLSQSVIRARLGLGKNDNLLALDLETLRRKVESHPWVRSISLSRNLPGTLRVEVAERTPWAVYAPAARGIKYLIDAEGVILADARAGSGKFPVLRGLDSSRKPPTAFEAGQMLGGAALEAGLGAIHAYLAMQPDFRRGGVRLAAVDMGRLETERTIQMDMLGPNGQSTLVRLSPRDMKGGFRRFAALIHQWRKTSWPGEVNLAMGSRVIVR